MMNSSTTSSHQGKDPNTDQSLSSSSDALQPLNSQESTSEQNSQLSMSEQNLQPTISEQNSQPTISEQISQPTILKQNSQLTISEQNSQPAISKQNSQPTISEHYSNKLIYTLSCPAVPYASHPHLAWSTREPGRQFNRQEVGPQRQHNQQMTVTNNGQRYNQSYYSGPTRHGLWHAGPSWPSAVPYASHPQLAWSTRQPGQQFNRQDAGPQQQYNQQMTVTNNGQHTDQSNYSGPTQRGQWHAGPPPQNMLYFVGYPYPQPSPQGAHRTSRIRRTGSRGEVTEQESHQSGWSGFTDKEVRAKFVRKVYLILMLQLLFTMGIIALFIFEPHVKKFVRSHEYLVWVALVILAAVYIGLACSTSMRRNFPCNIISLMVLTMAMSYQAGTISAFHNTEAVLMAAGICAAVCLVVTIFSYNTKFDFTSSLGILSILSMILIGFGIIAIFFQDKVMTMIYAAFGAVVFSLYLAYDTQMLLGGRKFELSPEEYVFAAIQIYIDVVQIFQHLLLLIGASEQ